MGNTNGTSFVDCAVAAARLNGALGRPTAALARLAPLLGGNPLPVPTTVTVRQLAAQLEIERDRFAAARRHLQVAITADPNNASLYFDLGTAFQDDPSGCDTRAARYFGKAWQRARTNAHYLAAWGVALVRSHRVSDGVARLNRAAKMAPGDLGVLELIVTGLLEAGRTQRARTIVNGARFAIRNTATINQLLNRIRFEETRMRQEFSGRARWEGTAVLPFVRLTTTGRTHTGSGVVRRDVASWNEPHLGRLRAHRAEPG
ncbi:MAG: hypothetical protein LC104_08090 [Bacteroidales bacterium]|nr:hypothetical protein [Bacteroidales bacterium]